MNQAELRVIDAAAGRLHLAAHVGLILFFFALALWLVWPFVLPLGLCLGALFPIMHEATHRHVFLSPKANQNLAFCTGAVLLISATWFRHFHQAHHRFTQDPSRDPELATPRPSTRLSYLWHLSGLPAWGSSLRLLIDQTNGKIGQAFVPARNRARIRREAAIILCLHALFFVACALLAPRVLLIAYGGLFIGQMFLRAFLLAEHGGLPFVSNVMENTRTTRAAAWLRWLTWNMSFHTEHHADPAVPYDKLPAFHELLGATICPSYPRFHRQFWGSISKN